MEGRNDQTMQVELELAGHLLEEGQLNDVLDLIHGKGGHAEIRSFIPGKTSEALSRAMIRASGVSSELLEILEKRAAVARIEVGPQEVDAPLETVDIDGAAPLDFYPTTIFPTDVRIAGRWVRVEKPRMDACIAERLRRLGPLPLLWDEQRALLD
jgi:hypothetical protein